MDVETLKSQFSELCAVEEKKKVVIEEVFQILALNNERIKHLELELESEKNSRRTFQVENGNANKEIQRLADILNTHPFIVVLVDGDGAKFLDSLLQRPEVGAAEASTRITKAVRDFLRRSPCYQEDVPILVRIYANLKDLARTLRSNKVIALEEDLHRFAEHFTNSRPEYEFINVGPGKENADSKMNRMLNHFYRNIQCKKIFFAACHDNGYLHQLRGFLGGSEEEKRIVLVETTPAGEKFRSLGFDIISFDNVFRCEHLPSEQVPTRSSFQRPSITPDNEINGRSSFPDSDTTSQGNSSQNTASTSPLTEMSLTQGLRMDSVVTVSGNGGVSVRYPSSYAKIGGSRHPQNITIKGRQAKEKKVIEYNKYDQRLDPPIRTSTDAAALDSYHKKLYEIAPRGFCNEHYLLGRCNRFKCKMVHEKELSPREIVIQKYKARQGQCPNFADCTDYDCYLSHHCPFGKNCVHSPCKFMLHISDGDLKVAERWFEDETEPDILET